MWILTAKSESGDDYGPLKKWDQEKKPDQEDVWRALVDLKLECDCVPLEEGDYEGPNSFDLDGIRYSNYLWPEVWKM